MYKPKQILLSLSLMLAVNLFAVDTLKIQAQEKTAFNLKIIDVSFCDLTKRPKAYRDKFVRIKATYSFSFENSRLFCSDCFDQNNPVWVDFENTLCSASKEIKNNKRYGLGRTLNVTFVGKYEDGGGYGHFGIFPARFVVGCVERTKQIANYGVAPSKLPEKVLSQTYCDVKAKKD